MFPGYPPGSEWFEAPDGRGGWGRYWSGIARPGGSTADFMRYSVFEDPDHDLTQFDFDDDWVLANTRPLGAGADDTLGSALNAVDPISRRSRRAGAS